jgi:hypothetical protein
MTKTGPGHPNIADGAIAPVARVAGLLEAVARDCEQAVDFVVPLRCGQAANRLHALLGYTPTQLPLVGDDLTSIASGLSEAITLLSSLPQDGLSDPILDALLAVRAAAQTVQHGAVS